MDKNTNDFGTGGVADKIIQTVVVKEEEDGTYTAFVQTKKVLGGANTLEELLPIINSYFFNSK